MLYVRERMPFFPYVIIGFEVEILMKLVILSLKLLSIVP